MAERASFADIAFIEPADNAVDLRLVVERLAVVGMQSRTGFVDQLAIEAWRLSLSSAQLLELCEARLVELEQLLGTSEPQAPGGQQLH